MFSSGFKGFGLGAYVEGFLFKSFEGVLLAFKRIS